MDPVIPGPRKVPVGRERELCRAEELFRDPRARLLTFTGPPGVGKTCVAVEAAIRLTAGSDGRFRAVNAEGITSYEELLHAVAGVLRVTAPDDGLEAALAARRPAVTGLVLDGLEHLTEEPHPVVRLLEVLDGARILATSLAPLKVPGEQVIGLDPLPVPPDPSVEGLRSAPAVRLFCQRAAQVDARFAPTGDDLRTIAVLCHRVHGLPLGIELLATRVVGQPLSTILENLEHGLEVGNERSQTGEPRRHSLRLALDWSYRTLDPTSAALLRRMSVFETPATVDMLAAVMAAVPTDAARLGTAELLDVVGDLVDHRLVEPYDGPGEPAFGLVDLIRGFGSERLHEEGEAAAVAAAHTTAVVGFARARAAAIEAAADDVALHELTRAERDLRLALQDATDSHDLADGLRLTSALAPFALCRGYDGLVGRPLATMVARIRTAGAGTAGAGTAGAGTAGVDGALLADAMFWSALLVAEFEGPTQREHVRALLADGLALARDAGDPGLVLLGLASVMQALLVTGDLPAAVAAAGEGLALAEAADDPRWAARFYGWAAMVAHQAHDLDRAVELAGRGLDAAALSGDRRAVIILALLVLGLPPERQGELASRLPATEELLASARRLHNRHYESLLLCSAVGEALARGDLTRAASLVVESLRLVQRQAIWHDVPLATFGLVGIALRRGDVTEAVRFFGALRPRLDDLRAGMPRWLEAQFTSSIDATRTALGEAGFERLALEGEQLARADVLAALGSYAEHAAGEHDPPIDHEPAGADGLPGDQEHAGELTPREREVLEQIITGATNQEIGRLLGMAPKTVMHHTSAIYRKLGVRGRAEATAWAFRRGLTR